MGPAGGQPGPKGGLKELQLQLALFDLAGRLLPMGCWRAGWGSAGGASERAPHPWAADEGGAWG